VERGFTETGTGGSVRRIPSPFAAAANRNLSDLYQT